MEAVAYDDQTMRFDSLLIQGQEYVFFSIGFVPTWEDDMRYMFCLHSDYYVYLSTHTTENAQSSILGIPQFPRTFMALQDVYNLDEFIFADIIGIIVYVSNTQGRDDSINLYRHVVLMDERNNFVIINVMKPHLLRHTIGEWRRAASEFCTLAALHLYMNSRRGGVTTNDFSEIVLSPICVQADAFQVGYEADHLRRKGKS
ncbi:hypothetical protein SORBI_3006G056900 [Sorghum bicolor]|uniref:Uncharacterized protein n=1 Tax=Sorghum bicolor TaxID=4558 RepID=A0A1Z5RCG9_SORBI|nr:hypothetical protein SORBI_3006G056900 [Sorghum bicolor]